MNTAERQHLGRIKELPCGNCGHEGPSSAHHITDCGRRISHFITIPLCVNCHQMSNGIHGDKTLWKIMGHTEMSVLGDTIEKLTQ